MPLGRAMPACFDASVGGEHDRAGGGDLWLAAVADKPGSQSWVSPSAGDCISTRCSGWAALAAAASAVAWSLSWVGRDRGDAGVAMPAAWSASCRRVSVRPGAASKISQEGCGCESHDRRPRLSPSVLVDREHKRDRSARIDPMRDSVEPGRPVFDLGARRRCVRDGRRSRCVPPRTRTAWRHRRR